MKRALLSFALAGLLTAAHAQVRVTRAGSQPARPAPAENFTGRARLEDPFTAAAPGRVYGARVVFEPGARTHWHTHPLGQTLLVTAGVGLVQGEGGPVEVIRAGDIVWIPAGQKHWHGAAPKTAMTHVAIVERGESGSTNWMEPVTDQQYQDPTPAPPAGQPTAAQRLMGDIAPKLADLTDQVLFGDVWARPQLSPRDRSLVTISALIAMNRPDQLRSHLARARANGVTEEEIVETITHLAFYSGWPNAVTAVGVAREVFRQP